MDREAAVIRQEMSHTRAALDQKLARLEERAREMSPRRVWQRKKPDYLADRALGAVLTVIGLRMAWGMYQTRRRRPAYVRNAIGSYETWS